MVIRFCCLLVLSMCGTFSLAKKEQKMEKKTERAKERKEQHGDVAEIISIEQYREMIEEADRKGMPIIIDAFAGYCGPCQRMKPIFHDVAKEKKGQAKFFILDTQKASDNPDLAKLMKKLGIEAVPTFIFQFKDLTEKYQGAEKKPGEFKQQVTNFIAKVDKMVEAELSSKKKQEPKAITKGKAASSKKK